MDTSDVRDSSNARSMIFKAAKIAWLPIAVFIAFDLSVSPEMSIMRSSDKKEVRATVMSGTDGEADPVAPIGEDTDATGSPHSYFGLEEDSSDELIAELNAPEVKGNSVSALGQWSGRFAGVLAGDAETDCWSAYDFDLVLNETETGVSGSGSYWVDPASCSAALERYVAFVDAKGKRTGNRINIDITGAGDGEAKLVFDGLIMRGRLSGWFYSPAGKPVSGPVVLNRQ